MATPNDLLNHLVGILPVELRENVYLALAGRRHFPSIGDPTHRHEGQWATSNAYTFKASNAHFKLFYNTPSEMVQLTNTVIAIGQSLGEAVRRELDIAHSTLEQWNQNPDREASWCNVEMWSSVTAGERGALSYNAYAKPVQMAMSLILKPRFLKVNCFHTYDYTCANIDDLTTLQTSLDRGFCPAILELATQIKHGSLDASQWVPGVTFGTQVIGAYNAYQQGLRARINILHGERLPAGRIAIDGPVGVFPVLANSSHQEQHHHYKLGRSNINSVAESLAVYLKNRHVPREVFVGSQRINLSAQGRIAESDLPNNCDWYKVEVLFDLGP